jgi:hypothetical protein
VWFPEAAHADLPVDEIVESHPPGAVEPLQSQTRPAAVSAGSAQRNALQSNKVMEKGGFLTAA